MEYIYICNMYTYMEYIYIAYVVLYVLICTRYEYISFQLKNISTPKFSTCIISAQLYPILPCSHEHDELNLP